MSIVKLENVSLLFQGRQWLAISVAISDQNDVYVNYLGNEQKIHTSHHASGQQHHKVGRRYVTWTADSSGSWEPMKMTKPMPVEVFERKSLAVWGWNIARIPEVLTPCQTDCGFIVNAMPFPNSFTLGLETSIINGDLSQRADILGFPVVQRQRVSNGVIVVEIEAFVVDEEAETQPAHWL